MVDLILGNDLKLRTENPTSNSLQRYQSCNVLYASQGNDLDFGFCERVGLTDCDSALNKAGSGKSERGPVGVKNAKFVFLNLLVANYWQMTNGNDTMHHIPN